MLSLDSGLANVTTLLRFERPVSHMTGNLSSMVLAVGSGEGQLFLRLFLALTLFLLGGMLSGFLFRERLFAPQKRYGVLLILGGLVSLFLRERPELFYFLCFFMGTQNAMFVGFRGTLVRTTHFTGYLSDIAFELGAFFSCKGHHGWKIRLYLASILCFLIGGAVAFWAVPRGGAELFLAGAYLMSGSYYFLLRRFGHWGPSVPRKPLSQGTDKALGLPDISV